MLKAFYHHWPEAHPEQFYDADHFRKWAQMKCGHFECSGYRLLRLARSAM
jgi:hypothetical protein